MLGATKPCSVTMAEKAHDLGSSGHGSENQPWIAGSSTGICQGLSLHVKYHMCTGVHRDAQVRHREGDGPVEGFAALLSQAGTSHQQPDTIMQKTPD